MPVKLKPIGSVKFHPLTKDLWTDFEKLFSERGACRGCWCMWWRLKRREFERMKGETNRSIMKSIVESGNIPGILAYTNNQPIAWCSVAPREHFQRLERSYILKRIDNSLVWSVVCFFVDKHYRNQEITLKLLYAAIEYVKQQGGKIVEGYPLDLKGERIPEAFVFTGLYSIFKKAGFNECARYDPQKPIMRYTIK